VEDGREIFDDDEEDYEVQTDSKKRKSLQKGKRSKLPDKPVSKKKSLKNFFGAKESKEKEVASVEDDNLLKSILGELNDSAQPEASTSAIAPRPMRSIRKQATESELEMKRYMEKIGKKAQAHEKNDGDVS